MKKVFYILMLMFASLLLLFGCDSASNPNDDADITESKTEAVADSEDDSVVTTEVTEETEEEKNIVDLPIPQTEDEKYWGNGSYSFAEIETITFLSTLDGMPSDAMDTSDKGKVMSWVISEGGKDDLYIAAEGGVWLPANRNNMFGDFSNVESISFNNSVHTDDISNMFGMFRNLRNLQTVDLSGINTSSATSMESMFAYCEKLETVDLTGFDTSNVYNMDCMFYECYALKSVDMSSFDFSKVQYIRSIFEDCKNLTDIGCEIILNDNVENSYMYENSGLAE